MSDHRPTRATTDGRAYLDLQNLARRTGRPTDELHQLYALEGFLARLADSEFADRLVLKGGVLLAAFGERRPTRDVDLYARNLSNGDEAMLACVKKICARPVEDGVTIDPESARAEMIRDDDEYAGIRVHLNGRLSIAKVAFHVDINVGDPVWPEPEPVQLPKILGGTLQIVGYPLPMVFAEKIVTMLERGTANTRWRDFSDVYTLSGTHAVDGSQLHLSLTMVASHRNVPIRPLTTALSSLPSLAQSKWSAWIRKQRLQDRLPEQFSEVLDTTAKFADAAPTRATDGRHWNPTTRTWS